MILDCNSTPKCGCLKSKESQEVPSSQKRKFNPNEEESYEQSEEVMPNGDPEVETDISIDNNEGSSEGSPMLKRGENFSYDDDKTENDSEKLSVKYKNGKVSFDKSNSDEKDPEEEYKNIDSDIDENVSDVQKMPVNEEEIKPSTADDKKEKKTKKASKPKSKSKSKRKSKSKDKKHRHRPSKSSKNHKHLEDISAEPPNVVFKTYKVVTPHEVKVGYPIYVKPNQQSVILKEEDLPPHMFGRAEIPKPDKTVAYQIVHNGPGHDPEVVSLMKDIKAKTKGFPKKRTEDIVEVPEDVNGIQSFSDGPHRTVVLHSKIPPYTTVLNDPPQTFTFPSKNKYKLETVSTRSPVVKNADDHFSNEVFDIFSDYLRESPSQGESKRSEPAPNVTEEDLHKCFTLKKHTPEILQLINKLLTYLQKNDIIEINKV